MPPAIPKPRRQLKIEPDGDAMLGELVRSLNRIADGVEAIVQFLDTVVETRDDGGPPAVRVVGT